MTQTNKPPEWWEEKYADFMATRNHESGSAKEYLDILDFIKQTLLTERAELRKKVENTNRTFANNNDIEEKMKCGYLLAKFDVLKLLE